MLFFHSASTSNWFSYTVKKKPTVNKKNYRW